MQKRVSIQWVKAILFAAKELGIQPDQVLMAAKLELDLYHNQPEYLTLTQTQAIWQQVEKLSGHPHFGLIMGQAFRPYYFNVVAYLAMTSENLDQAFKHFQQYLPLISEGAKISIDHLEQDIRINFIPQIEQAPFTRHQYEAAMSLLITVVRWLVSNPALTPKKVCFQHEKGPNLTPYSDAFGLMPLF